jgi:archaellum component FlaC
VELGKALAQIGSQLQRLDADVERLKGEIQMLTKALKMVEEEAKKASSVGAAVVDPAIPEQNSLFTDIRNRFP